MPPPLSSPLPPTHSRIFVPLLLAGVRLLHTEEVAPRGVASERPSAFLRFTAPLLARGRLSLSGVSALQRVISDGAALLSSSSVSLLWALERLSSADGYAPAFKRRCCSFSWATGWLPSLLSTLLLSALVFPSLQARICPCHIRLPSARPPWLPPTLDFPNPRAQRRRARPPLLPTALDFPTLRASPRPRRAQLRSARPPRCPSLRATLLSALRRAGGGLSPLGADTVPFTPAVLPDAPVEGPSVPPPPRPASPTEDASSDVASAPVNRPEFQELFRLHSAAIRAALRALDAVDLSAEMRSRCGARAGPEGRKATCGAGAKEPKRGREQRRRGQHPQWFPTQAPKPAAGLTHLLAQANLAGATAWAPDAAPPTASPPGADRRAERATSLSAWASCRPPAPPSWPAHLPRSLGPPSQPSTELLAC